MKRYTVNGVEVSYEIYDRAMNGDPNDFGNLNNLDAPDIPQVYKDQYSNDRRNERAGRGHPWWTPRQRMLNEIQHKDKLLAEKKTKRLQQREKKMQAWGEQRRSDDEWRAHLDLMHRSDSERASNQQVEDKKSATLMIAVIGGGFLLMCLLFAASVYIG